MNRINPNSQDYNIALFNTYHKTIYNFAYKMTGNKEDAEDILQEVFCIALQNIQNFRGESKVSTWLYAITKNVCLQHLKKTSRSSFTVMENLIHTAKNIGDDEEFTCIEKSYYIDQVKEGCFLGLIRCLTLSQRIAFILNVLYDVKISEVALIVNKTENAARILIHRAKQNIKQFLCKNCSLYNSSNSCRCEDLINFSLKNKWIQRYANSSNRKNLTSQEVANDLTEFKRIIHLYRSLTEHTPSQDFVQRIKHEISNGKYSIFFSKK